jgi:methyl-accepting chemotaxis protein
LRQIVAEVSAVSTLVEQIAEAAGQQAAGIADISAMVGSMDSFTQQNAAMVEESSAGTRNLATETVALVEQLGRFQLSGSTTRFAEARPARHEPHVPYSPPAETYRPAPTNHAPMVVGNTALKADADDWDEF